MRIVVGVTGTFGSGKSTVARMFMKNGAKIIDADEIAKGLGRDEKVKTGLKKNFGTTDSKKIAEIVFSDNKKLERLNKVYHPLVISEAKNRINKSKGIIVLDVPLLIETGMNKLCDVVIVVRCSGKNQIERLSKRFSKADIKKRAASQLSVDDKIKYADFVIDNNGPVSKTKNQFEKIWRCINENSSLSRNV